MSIHLIQNILRKHALEESVIVYEDILLRRVNVVRLFFVVVQAGHKQVVHSCASTLQYWFSNGGVDVNRFSFDYLVVKKVSASLPLSVVSEVDDKNWNANQNKGLIANGGGNRWCKLLSGVQRA